MWIGTTLGIRTSMDKFVHAYPFRMDNIVQVYPRKDKVKKVYLHVVDRVADKIG